MHANIIHILCGKCPIETEHTFQILHFTEDRQHGFSNVLLTDTTTRMPVHFNGNMFSPIKSKHKMAF